MWLLPLDFRAKAHTELPPGRYLVPWYLPPSAVSRVAGLLGYLVEGVEHRVELPWGALPLPRNQGLHGAETVLVAVRVPAGVSPAEADARLTALGGKYQVVQFADAQAEGYGWQEKLKEPVLSLIRRNVGRPDHPLASLNVARLPLSYAARLTTDVIELLDLLRDAVHHRLHFAAHGLDAADYLHSLKVVAGRRLARRLTEVPLDAREAALEVLLAGRKRLERLDDPLPGALSLRAVGLAWVAGSDVNIGPLGRKLEDDIVRGAFLDALPPDALTEPMRRLLPEVDSGLRRFRAGPGGAAEASGRRGGGFLWTEVVRALRQATGEVTGDGLVLGRAIEMLDALAATPSYVTALSDEAAEAAVATLRAVERMQPFDDAAAALRPVLTWILTFQASRGPGRLPDRERAWTGLKLQVDADAPLAFRLAFGAATSELAWDLVTAAGDRDTLARAGQVCRDALALVPPRTAVAASLMGVLAHLHANRGEPDEALALHRKRLATFEALGAPREAAVTQARVGRILAARGDLDEALRLHEQALAALAELGAEHDVAVSQGDVARIKAARGQVDDALALHRERLATFERLGARHSAAIAQGDVARLLAARGELDEALDLHEARLAAFTDLGNQQGRAIALGDIARIRAERGEYDEALDLHQQRLTTFESLDDLDGIAITRLNIGQIEVERGHLESAELALRTSWALNRKLGHAEGVATAGEALGLLLLRTGQIAEGRAIVAEAVDRYAQLGQGKKAKRLERTAARIGD